MKSRGSLGGQNTVGRYTGARSSRALSTLFRRLRQLDRKIGNIDYRAWIMGHIRTPDLKERERLDELRRAVRLKRKGYSTQKGNAHL